MIPLDVEQFVAQYKLQDPNLSGTAESGLNMLLGFIAEDPDVSDLRWAAYMLATVRHECANLWRPVEEYGMGAGHPYGLPATVAAPDGTTYTNSYYGRGYVQLTWRYNTDRMGHALGLSNALVLHPEQALEPQTSCKVMSFGMRNGSFTGKSLKDYIHDDVCDYLNARQIINGLDQAPLIQSYAANIEALLRANLAANSASPQTAAVVGPRIRRFARLVRTLFSNPWFRKTTIPRHDWRGPGPPGTDCCALPSNHNRCSCARRWRWVSSRCARTG